MCGLLTIVCIFVFNFFKLKCVYVLSFNITKNVFFKNNKCVCVLYLNLTKKNLKEKNVGQPGFVPGCPGTQGSEPNH